MHVPSVLIMKRFLKQASPLRRYSTTVMAEVAPHPIVA